MDLDDAVIAVNGTITASINLIAQGVTESQRIGRKCTIEHILWRWNIQQKSQAVMSATSITVRLIVYHDKQANGAAASVTDILESDNFQSFNNLSNSGRFRILYDRVMSKQQDGSIAGPVTNEWEVNGSFFKKVSIPIEFSAATGAIGEIRSNNIGVLILGGANSGSNATLDSKFRLRFSDN